MISLIDNCVVKVESNLREALKVLNQGGLEIVLVIDESQKLLGILTDGDVRRALLEGADLQFPLKPYINKKFLFVNPQTGRGDVLDLMQARRISQIPILDANGKLVGLHTIHDILGAAIKPNWAIIMAGGRGERLKPITDDIPKPMIRIAGRPIIERLILHFISHGIRKIFISVNYKANIIEKYFGDGNALGCEIGYIRETMPLGTGGSLSLLREKPIHPLIVCNGDLLTQVNVTRLLKFHKEGGFRATVTYQDYSLTIPYGVLETQDYLLQSIREKPTEIWKTNAGIYVLDPFLIELVPPDKYYSLPSLIEECLQREEGVGTFPIEEDWIDIGCPRDLNKALGESKRNE